MMKELFPEIVDIEFTAHMEKKLDAVDSGKADWVDTLSEFYRDFAITLENAEKATAKTRIAVPDEETDIECELCGRKMVIKTGRYGEFLACPGYPECKNTKKLVKEAGGACPKCGGKIVVQKSRNNRTFYGCSNYRTAISCRGTRLPKSHAPNAAKPCSGARAGRRSTAPPKAAGIPLMKK